MTDDEDDYDEAEERSMMKFAKFLEKRSIHQKR